MYKEIQNLTKVITTEFAGAVKEEKKAITSPLTSAWFLPINVRAMASPLTPALRQKSALLTKERGGEGAQQSGKNNCKYLIEGENNMLKIKSNRKTAFTFMETLITVVILGILAAILVPNLIKNQVENANRTKVKKAMAAYEKAINMMIIENDIKSTEALRELGQDNCQYTREYFKTVQDGSNNCIFKTADRVWWDITDITNPIISLKDEITNSNKASIRVNAMNYDADKVSFALIGRFDEVGSLRVDDNGFEQSQENNDDNKNYMIKLWAFINNTQPLQAGEIIANEPEVPLTGFAKCNAEGADICIITVNGVDTTYNRIITNADTVVDKKSNGNPLSCIYNRNSNPTRTCNGYASIAPAGNYWISDNLGYPTADEAKEALSDSVCTQPANCIANGDRYEAAKRKCESQGAHLATLAELRIAASNGKMTSGNFWASEEYLVYESYYMNSNGIDISSVNKDHPYMQVICVGNN